MIRLKPTKTLAALAAPAILFGWLGCSTDSPTAPTQQPIPPGSGAPSAQWLIDVFFGDDEMFVDGSPVTVQVRVREAGTQQPPASGTTIVVSTSLGEFNESGSGLSSVAASTVGGRTTLNLFPGGLPGTAFVTAQLETSAGQSSIPVLDALPPLVAAFSTENTTDNFSIQFVNNSTGNPDRYLWDFGDGATSTEKHPFHIYQTSGDFVVELTIFRGEEFDNDIQAVRVIEAVFITAMSPTEGPIGTRVELIGVGFDIPLRVLFGGVLAPIISSTSERIVTEVPEEIVFDTESCEVPDTLEAGLMLVDTTVPVTVEVKGVTSDTLNPGFRVLAPSAACFVDPDAPVVVP